MKDIPGQTKAEDGEILLLRLEQSCEDFLGVADSNWVDLEEWMMIQKAQKAGLCGK